MCFFFLSLLVVVHNDVQQQQQQQQRSNGDGTLSPTSNQLARWFSPELLAQGAITFSKNQYSNQYPNLVVIQYNFNLLYFCYSFCR